MTYNNAYINNNSVQTAYHAFNLTFSVLQTCEVGICTLILFYLEKN